VAASLVTTTGSPPPLGMVAISLRPTFGGRNQYAMRWPCGDHEGCIASDCVSSRLVPVLKLTTQIALGTVVRTEGMSRPDVL
jgi:hypothetical protein